MRETERIILSFKCSSGIDYGNICLYNALQDALKKYNEICSLRLESLIRLVQMDLSKSDRVKIITVITIDVHNRDVVTALVQKKVVRLN